MGAMGLQEQVDELIENQRIINERLDRVEASLKEMLEWKQKVIDRIGMRLLQFFLRDP